MMKTPQKFISNIGNRTQRHRFNQTEAPTEEKREAKFPFPSLKKTKNDRYTLDKAMEIYKPR